MRKRLITGLLLLVMVQGAFAGGILTNTNQSVQFVRMLSRNASTDIDAVYFNPAGITLLADGFHFAIYSQTITQGRIVTSTLPTLNQAKYEGDTFVPVFPSLYAVYKKAKMAFALGFGPIAGGGTADFKKGLPDIESTFSVIPSLLSNLPFDPPITTTAYSADIAFKGSSIFYGIQFSFAYAIHEKISASVGARYNLAQNAYEGSIENIMINPYGGPMMSASAFFQLAASNLGSGHPYYNTLLGAAALTSDQELDVAQSGSGITPFFGLHFRPTDKLNIGLKYEMATTLELENDTKKDLAAPMFPDGEKNRNDIPAILSGGMSYQLTDALLVSVGGNYYFDKNADWEGREDLIDSNQWEYQVGIQYQVKDNIGVSAGFQHTACGVMADYQSGLSYDLGADAIGAGVRIGLGQALALELGGLYTIYKPFEKEVDAFVLPGFGAIPGTAHEITYDKTAWLVAVGLEYTIGK